MGTSRLRSGSTQCATRWPRHESACARRQVQAGNFGDCEPVGEGVIELRVHVGAGYRVYCGRHGKAVVLLLCGGDKGSQSADIKRAKALWSEWKRRQT